MNIDRVAIIGAGLAGLSLALLLKQRGIDSTIYETRPAGTTSTGAIMLSPNALKTLDALGVYARIKDKGYSFRDLTFRTNDHEYINSYEMGNADKFGYDALRVYRQVILDEHIAMVKEAGVPVVHGKKFSHVISEDDQGVTFAFADGEQQTVSLLVGADGIHSTVRKFLAPDIEPAFSNVMAVTCAIPTSALNLPFTPYSTPVSIHGKAGAFVLAAQNPDGSELLGGIQYRTQARSRKEWDDLYNDKQQLLAMMRSQYDAWNPMIQSAMDAVPLHTLSIWAFHTVPKLKTWVSQAGRVVLVGDSAHAIPPAAGKQIEVFPMLQTISVCCTANNLRKATAETTR